MKLRIGSVVMACAGRDSGKFFVVTKFEDKCVYIADGRERKLDKPKRKNIKHIRITDSVIELNEITDNKLKKLTMDFNSFE